jgi:hypothetical protein
LTAATCIFCVFIYSCLLQHHLGQSPTFTHEQQRWASRRRVLPRRGDCPPLAAAGRGNAPCRRTAVSDPAVYAAENPDPIRDGHQQDRRLHLAISGLIHRFQNLAGRPFSDEQGLSDQLYIHLAGVTPQRFRYRYR